MSKMQTIGWDIGGAHLKAVLLGANGEVQHALQLPCKLWLGLDQLEMAILKVLSTFNAPHATHAVTMTGELVDGFANRLQGVQQIADCAVKLLGHQTQFYAGQASFVAHAQVAKHAHNIASANWHASASLVAQHVPNALFVDIGSTTTDLIGIVNSQLQIAGYTDAQRLQTGELLYTGVVRTPLMALAKKINFNQQNQSVAAEHFATTGDVYRLTNDLSEADFSGNTADGGAKTPAACAVRLARMVGWDAENAALNTWIALAETYKSIQLNDFKMAISAQLMRFEGAATTLVIAGAGTFLTPSLMPHFAQCNLKAASEFITAKNSKLKALSSVCFPAFAVAALLTFHQKNA